MHRAGRLLPLRHRPLGLNSVLTALALLMVVPVLVYAAVLLYLMSRDAHEVIQRELVASNRALVAVFEREIQQAEKLLTLIVHSPGLGERAVDNERVELLMRRIGETAEGLSTFAVLNPEGRVVAQYPPNDVPAQGLSRYHEEVFRTGRVVISDMHESVFDGARSVSINLPVVRKGTIAWVVTARFDLGHLSAVLASQATQRGAVATVLDRNHVIIARSQELERFVGKLPSAQTVEALASGPTGARRFATLDGSELLWAWTTLPTGWIVFLGTPANLADAALGGSMLRLTTVGLLTLLLGVGLMGLVSRRIVRSVDIMTANAPRLAVGERLAYKPSGIRQLDELYHALEDASARLRQQNRAKDVFIATLAHELRNPLAPIRNAAHMLQSPRLDEARRQWAAGMIERQVRAMARLLDDLLDISRVDSGRIRLDVEPVNLAQVLDSAIEVARPLIESRRHRLNVQQPGDEIIVEGDELRLSQVFSNLLANAAKYTDPGGRIDVEVKPRGDEVVVAVRDTGIGVEPAKMGSLFEVFTQVGSPQDRSQGGLGIGLALVKGLVELHGGWVRGHSEGLGRGSEFLVGLPLARRRPDMAPSG